MATRFLTRGWVDVFPRKGKTGGAFCSPGFPPEHPWVMVNFTGKTDNVFTLAHELGHALHFTLSLEQSPLNYWTGLPLAETASVFSELWLHEHLMSTSDDAVLRRQLLDRQIQGAVGTAFNQVSSHLPKKILRSPAAATSLAFPSAPGSIITAPPATTATAAVVATRSRSRHPPFARHTSPHTTARGTELWLGIAGSCYNRCAAIAKCELERIAAGDQT